MHYRVHLFAAAVTLLLGANAPGATLSTWNPASGNWSNASGWTPPVVPNNSAGAAYDVAINGGVTLDVNAAINSLALNGAIYGPVSGVPPQLTVVHDANISGDLEFGGSVFSPPVGPASFAAGGNVTVGSSAIFVSGGAVSVGGNFTNSSHEIDVYTPPSSSLPTPFEVSGTLTNGPRSSIWFGNSRCFSLLGCPEPFAEFIPIIVGGPSSVSARRIVNNGQINSWTNINASVLSNSGTLSLVGGANAMRTLQSAGTIYLASSCCSIAPEATASLNVGSGSFLVNGYNQSADGVLDEVLGGPSTYGRIIASPWFIPGGIEQGYAFNLNGTLEVSFANGFVPSIGETFTIIATAPGYLNGAFSNVVSEDGGAYFKVSYDNSAGDVTITAEPVPEPRSWLLLLPALPFLYWRVQSSRKNRRLLQSVAYLETEQGALATPFDLQVRERTPSAPCISGFLLR